MKEYFKSIFTPQSPLGEVWLVVVGAVILFVFGVIDFREAKSWLLAAGIFGGIIILSTLIRMCFKK